MTQHVMVVDDDLAQCEILQRVLSGADIESVVVTDSRQAIAIAKSNAFDAIFVDLTMPPPDGMEVTRQIRASERNSKTPIVMITGNEDPSIVARGFQAGITFFLYKPIVKDRLLNLVRLSRSVNLVEKRRFQRVEVRRKVNLQFNGNSLEGDTVDVSLNGMLVHAARTLQRGSRVKIALDWASDKKPFIVTGMVTRVTDRDCMGIRFDTIAIGESKRLQDFLLPLLIARGDDASEGAAAHQR